QMLKKDHEFYLVTDNEARLGFISLGRDSQDVSVFTLHKIYILPKMQGKGIGNMLLNFAIERTKNSGGKFLQLNVNRHNKALAFYKKHGFSVILEEDIDIGNGYFMNDYKMQLEIPV